ncbi:MAG: superoxide dismutase [Phycisphaerae bacterium]|nr:superoxide dismutase [Phycisphaerae bacterium]
MSFTLPDLPYSFDALEPHIDARTMEIHHDKHHAGYVAKLNAAIEGHADLAGKSIEELISNLDSVPDSIRNAVRNNGGGHANHSLFWKVMCPAGGGTPSGELAEAINAAFGSFEDFKSKFADAAATRFGSGWAWLCVCGDGLCVSSTANQDNPLMADVCNCDCLCLPIMGIDVWEHAYYLNYQNRRPDYVSAFWNVVNWDTVAENYAAAQTAIASA